MINTNLSKRDFYNPSTMKKFHFRNAREPGGTQIIIGSSFQEAKSCKKTPFFATFIFA